MCIQIIHDQNDFFCIRIHDIREILNFLCPISGSSMFSYADMPDTAKRLTKYEDTTSAVSHILRIDFTFITGTHRKRFPCFAKKLIWFFIHANHRNLRIVR